MVQELSGFDCAMYPRQSTYNMFSGYPQQGYANVTASDYAGFNVTDPGLQHQTSAGAGCWYPGTTTATGGRSASAGLEDWGAQYGVNIPVSGNQSPTGSYNYQGRAGLVNLHHGQSSDYGGSPNNIQSSLNSSMGLSNSPSPTGIPPYSQANTSSSNVNAIAQRQTSRQPYDWMKKQSYPLTPSTGKTRTKDKYRVVYTDHQRLELEKEFHYSRYITIRRKAELAQTLSLSERQVKIWFQNRRAKERKHNKKREESLKGSSTGDLSGLPQGGMVSPGTMNMQGQSQLTTGVATSQHSHLDSHAPGTPVTQQGHSGIAVPNLALSQSSQMPPIVISPRSQQQPNSGPQTHT